MSAMNDWKSQFSAALPALGHRNWIVVADSAYPKQVAAGIKTIVTAEDHIDVLRGVLDAIDRAPHVRPMISVDSELAELGEADAPGIDDLRDALDDLLSGHAVIHRAHEETIRLLDEAGKTFEVVVLKTACTLPYTTVFIELDCGYWSADAEARLRLR